jgi:hypothetical protein
MVPIPTARPTMAESRSNSKHFRPASARHAPSVPPDFLIFVASTPQQCGRLATPDCAKAHSNPKTPINRDAQDKQDKSKAKVRDAPIILQILYIPVQLAFLRVSALEFAITVPPQPTS